MVFHILLGKRDYKKWVVKTYVKDIKHKPVGSGRYANGQKRCQICELFIRWDGPWCPCCGYKLRTRPRNLRLKAEPVQKLLFNRNY